MLTDGELYRRFEDGTLAKADFGHREHVRAAFLYLSRHPDLAEAAARFRPALRRLAAGYGVPGLFHETLTWAYLVVISGRMRRAPCADSLAFLSANPDLASHASGPLSRLYDLPAITASPLAREVFVLPGAWS